MNLPLNIDTQQIFLHLFNFIILTGGLYLLLYKPVKDFMDKRTAYYEELDRQTKEKLSEAQALKEEYQEQMQAVDKEISEHRSQAVMELQKQCEEELKSAKKQAAKIVAGAQDEAEHERDRILSDAQKEIAGLAAAATKKLLYRSVTEAYEQFLSSAEGSEVNE